MIRKVVLREFGFANLGLSLVWSVAIICGIIVMLNYELRPGNNPDQLTEWPANSILTHSTDQPVVLMFVHPHCPCTRASVAEWERAMTMCFDEAEFKVVAFEPVDAKAQWRKSDLVARAAANVDDAIFWDKDGVEARRFKIQTSGHVLMYNSKGQLIFSGGITASRGHQGSNSGRSQMVAWLLKDPGEQASSDTVMETPVYGCALFDGSEVGSHD